VSSTEAPNAPDLGVSDPALGLREGPRISSDAMRLSALRAAHRIEDVLAVANTRHGRDALRPLPPTERVAAREGFDRLRDRSEAARFLSALGVTTPSGAPSLEQILQFKLIREAVRALAEGDEVGYRRRVARVGSAAAFRLEGDQLRPTVTGWEGLIVGLLLPLVELRQHAGRLRVCHNAACGWVFLDQTRNGGMVWCEEQHCGERVRSRRYRRRHRR
jgi:hypothetical protein